MANNNKEGNHLNIEEMTLEKTWLNAAEDIYGHLESYEPENTDDKKLKGKITSISEILQEFDSDDTREKVLLLPLSNKENHSCMHKVLSDKQFYIVGGILKTVTDEEIKATLLQEKCSTDDESPMILGQLLDEEWKNMKVGTDEQLESYLLFHTEKTFKSHKKLKRSNVLNIISQSRMVDLMQHEYVQKYIRCFWDAKNWKSMIWSSFICYFILMIAMTASIITFNLGHYSHTAQDAEKLAATNKQPVQDHTQVVPLHAHGVLVQKIVIGIFAVIPALILIAIEILQLVIKRMEYFKYIPNYFDIFIPVISVVTCIVNMLPMFHLPPWTYATEVFSTFTLLTSWMYGAWKFATIPHIPPGNVRHKNRLFQRIYNMYINTLKETSINCMMFFAVLESICWALHVIVYIIIMFAIAFCLLVKTDDEFKDVGHGIIGIAIITMGDINFRGTFHDWGANDYFITNKTKDAEGVIHGNDVDYKFAFAYLLLLLFFASLPIASMNLLIGKAISDVNEIKDKCEIHIFGHQVDSYMEYCSLLAFLGRGKDDEKARMSQKKTGLQKNNLDQTNGPDKGLNETTAPLMENEAYTANISTVVKIDNTESNS